jgi:hypothetical protein
VLDQFRRPDLSTAVVRPAPLAVKFRAGALFRAAQAIVGKALAGLARQFPREPLVSASVSSKLVGQAMARRGAHRGRHHFESGRWPGELAACPQTNFGSGFGLDQV